MMEFLQHLLIVLILFSSLKREGSENLLLQETFRQMT